MIKRLIVLGSWIVAVVLIAALVVSMGFSFLEALFIGLMFLPGAFAARFCLSHISYGSRKAETRDIAFVFLAILVAEIALVVIASILIIHMRHMAWWNYYDYPGMLSNPVFIGMILLLLIIGDSALARYLDKRYPSNPKPIRFISDRKAVSLPLNEILYVESNDKEVMIYATEGRHFRNKTGISQWENILGSGFLRIHRSYLVNVDHAELVSPDVVSVIGSQLPVSRKYKKDTAILRRQNDIEYQSIN